MNMNKLIGMMPIGSKRRGRNTLLLSLLGATVAGGVTYFGMKRGKSGNGLNQMLKQFTNQMKGPQMVKTN